MIKSCNLLTIALLFFVFKLSAQQERVELGEVCYKYFENYYGEYKQATLRPFTYDKTIELHFKSNYQITIKEEEKKGFITLIKQFEAFHKRAVQENINEFLLIGTYSPAYISFPKKVLDNNASFKIWYAKEPKANGRSDGYIIIEIPELKNMYSFDVAPSTNFIFTNDCVKQLLRVLE